MSNFTTRSLQVFLIIFIIQVWNCYAPPVTKNEKEHAEETNPDPLDFIHYSRYLKQVVNILESDSGFKKKLEEASEDDIKSGKIAHELDFVSHHVRSKLNELKRIELDRLTELKHRLAQQELDNNEINGDELLHGHLDRSNRRSFEIDDLKKLISKTTEDLAEADRRRREEFKQYELQKEFEKQDKLNHTNGVEERDKLEKEYKEMEEKHKKHEPLHQPGHKAQLEEVWQEQDHMQQRFDPVAFFKLHDVNSDQLWDQTEVKALFIKELSKLYESGVPEDDIREREEEMERMREAVFQEMDHDRDGFISEKEFLLQTRRNEFEQDRGWKGLDEQRQFSDEELKEYIRQQQMLHPPPPGYHVPPGGYHPNQVPQGYPPQGQYNPGQQQPQYYQQPQQPPPHYPPQHYQQGQQPVHQPVQPQAPNLPHPGQQHQQPNLPHPGQQYQQPNPPHPGQQYQQPNPPQVPNQALPGQQYNVHHQIPQQPPPPPIQQQQYQQPQAQQVNQNQPSPQVNPEAKSIHTP